jgi:hypothetical protein
MLTGSAAPTSEKKPRPTSHRLRYWQRELRTHELAADGAGAYQAQTRRAVALAMPEAKYGNMLAAGKLRPHQAAVELLACVPRVSVACATLLGHIAMAASWRNLEMAGDGPPPLHSGLFVPVRALAKACKCGAATVKRNIARLVALGLVQRLPWFEPLTPSSKGGGPRQRQTCSLLIPGERLAAALGIKALRIERRKWRRAVRRRQLRALGGKVAPRRKNQVAQIDSPTAKKPQPTAVAFSGGPPLEKLELDLWASLAAAAEQMRLSARKVRPLARPRSMDAGGDAARAELERLAAPEAVEGGGALAPAASSQRPSSGAQRSVGRRSQRERGGAGPAPRRRGGAGAASGEVFDQAERDRLGFAATIAAIRHGDRPSAPKQTLELAAKLTGDEGAAALAVASPSAPKSPSKSAGLNDSAKSPQSISAGRTYNAPSSNSARSMPADLAELAAELGDDDPRVMAVARALGFELGPVETPEAIDAEEEAHYAALRSRNRVERPSRPVAELAGGAGVLAMLGLQAPKAPEGK